MSKIKVEKTFLIHEVARESEAFRTWLGEIWREMYFSPTMFRDKTEDDPDILTPRSTTLDMMPTAEELRAERDGEIETYRVERDITRGEVENEVSKVMPIMSDEMAHILDLVSSQAGRFSLLDQIEFGIWLGSEFAELTRAIALTAGHGEVLQEIYNNDFTSSWSHMLSYFSKTLYSELTGKPVEQMTEEDDIARVENFTLNISFGDETVTATLSRD